MITKNDVKIEKIDDDRYKVSVTPTAGPLVSVLKSMIYRMKLESRTFTKLESKSGLAINPENFKSNAFIVTCKSEDAITKSVEQAISDLEKDTARKEKQKETAPARKAEASKISNERAKEEKERLEKLYGKGTPARVKYRQIGGDDGYQYSVFVDGKPITAGDNLSTARWEAKRAMDRIAQKEKLGKYAVSESTTPFDLIRYADNKIIFHEDWGTSDWYPVMKNMAREITYQTKHHPDLSEDEILRSAALEAGSFYAEHMGYDDEEDLIDAVVAHWNRMSSERKTEFMTMAKEDFDSKHSFESIAISEGTFRLVNKEGDYKRFKRDDSAEAKAWKNSTPKADAKAEKDKLVIKYKEDEAKKLTSIWRKAEEIVSNGFPDTDPYDDIYRWMRKAGYKNSDLDKAFKAKVGMTFDKYLISMWQTYADQAVYDAENDQKAGKSVDQYSPFFDVDKDGKIKPIKNPWK